MKKSYDRNRRIWTTEEVEFLIYHYGKSTKKEIAFVLERKIKAIEKKYMECRAYMANL
jgi:hypothetical protein